MLRPRNAASETQTRGGRTRATAADRPHGQRARPIGSGRRDAGARPPARDRRPPASAPEPRRVARLGVRGARRPRRIRDAGGRTPAAASRAGDPPAEPGPPVLTWAPGRRGRLRGGRTMRRQDRARPAGPAESRSAAGRATPGGDRPDGGEQGYEDPRGPAAPPARCRRPGPPAPTSARCPALGGPWRAAGGRARGAPKAATRSAPRAGRSRASSAAVRRKSRGPRRPGHAAVARAIDRMSPASAAQSRQARAAPRRRPIVGSTSSPAKAATT